MSKLKIKKADLLLVCENISQNVHNSYWWKNDKKLLKALKVYKKLKINEYYNLVKKGNKKYRPKLHKSLNKWCSNCLTAKQCESIKKDIALKIK